MRWLGLALLMLVAGLAGWWSADWKAAPRTQQSVVSLYLLDNGFHTDLAVPRALLMAYDDALAEATASSGQGDWFLIGWGDSRFYQEEGEIIGRVPDGLRALFTPGGSTSVVRFIPVQTEASQDFPYEAVAFSVDEKGAIALRKRILETLTLDAEREPVAAKVMGSAVSNATFWDSPERFSAVHLCNHWMASVLYAGGVSVPVGRSLVSAELTRAVEAYNEGRTGLDRPQ